MRVGVWPAAEQKVNLTSLELKRYALVTDKMPAGFNVLAETSASHVLQESRFRVCANTQAYLLQHIHANLQLRCLSWSAAIGGSATGRTGHTFFWWLGKREHPEEIYAEHENSTQKGLLWGSNKVLLKAVPKHDCMTAVTTNPSATIPPLTEYDWIPLVLFKHCIHVWYLHHKLASVHMH